MTPALFQRFRDFVHGQAGIDLPVGKDGLVSARIAGRVRALSLPSEEAYLEHLLAPQGRDEVSAFIDVISTNFTHFFREAKHFDLLRRFVRDLTAAGRSEVRVWCAASSSGEEPYTLAMVLDDALSGRGVTWRVLATDISTRMLERATAATYDAAQLEPVPPAYARRYLVPGPDGRSSIAPALRARVSFGRLNLSRPPFPMRGPFDVIFCRNVMIYFDTAIRQGLVQDVERLLAPGGLFIVGHTETLTGVKTQLECAEPSVYVKPRTR